MSTKTVPMLTALNLDLRNEYAADCENGVKRWNQELEDAGLEERLYLPHQGFNRRVGVLRRPPRHARPARSSTTPPGRRTVGDYLPTARGPGPGRRADGAALRARRVRRLDLARPRSASTRCRSSTTTSGSANPPGPTASRPRCDTDRPPRPSGTRVVRPRAVQRRRVAGHPARAGDAGPPGDHRDRPRRQRPHPQLRRARRRRPPVRRRAGRVGGPPGGAAAAVHGRHARSCSPRSSPACASAPSRCRSARCSSRRTSPLLARDSRARLVALSSEFAALGAAPSAAAATWPTSSCSPSGALPRSPAPGSATGPRSSPPATTSSSRSPTPYPTVADSPAFWLYTSGTTGTPKGAMHRHGSLRDTAETYARDVLAIGPDDVTFSVAKFFFAYGLGNTLTFPFSVGGEHGARPVPAEPGRHAAGPPGAPADAVLRPARRTTRRCWPRGLPDDAFAGVRACVSAGEAFPAALFERFTSTFGVEMLDGIGSTEMLHIFISGRPGRTRAGSTRRDRRRLRGAGSSTTTARPVPDGTPGQPLRAGQLGGDRLLVPHGRHPAGLPGRLGAHRRHLRPQRRRLLQLAGPHRRHHQGRRHLGLPHRGRGTAARAPRRSPRSSSSSVPDDAGPRQAGRLRRPRPRRSRDRRGPGGASAATGWPPSSGPGTSLVFDELPDHRDGQAPALPHPRTGRSSGSAVRPRPTSPRPPEAPRDRDRHPAARVRDRRRPARRRRPAGRRRRAGRALRRLLRRLPRAADARSSTACPNRAARSWRSTRRRWSTTSPASPDQGPRPGRRAGRAGRALRPGVRPRRARRAPHQRGRAPPAAGDRLVVTTDKGTRITQRRRRHHRRDRHLHPAAAARRCRVGGPRPTYVVKELAAHAGQDVVIVGGGDSAVDWALALDGLAASVTVVHRRKHFRAHAASVADMEQGSTVVVTDAAGRLPRGGRAGCTRCTSSTRTARSRRTRRSR